ncbi:MAG TPA: hypothetical protein VMZ30_19945 [Pyrinomonadaceae bacterium]|nr:hypothetical protein [Pyrinomonadaceae bacterium]
MNVSCVFVVMILAARFSNEEHYQALTRINADSRGSESFRLRYVHDISQTHAGLFVLI